MRPITHLHTALFGAAFAFALSVPAMAAQTHQHGDTPQTTLQVQLDSGKRWQSDEALRAGMTRMRDAMANALPQIHTGKLSASEFDALAGVVHQEIDYVTTNCKLPEDADLVLHGILEAIIDGADAMKAPADRTAGAVRIVQALDVYGKSFDHPGWQQLTD